jgi:hypothetical protein
MKPKGSIFAVLIAAALATGGCKDEPKQKPKPAASASAAASAAKAPAPVASAEQSTAAAARTKGWPIPTGPRMAILRGEGIGPIRFGATRATIERLMQGSCDAGEKAEDVCRFTGSGLEFFLKDGVLEEIHIHRPQRPSQQHEFGVFNGRFVEGAAFGMHEHVVTEMLGKPERVEKPQDGGVAGTVAVHHYDGMRLEYDKLENGNSVLGEVILTRWKNPAPKGAAPKKPAPFKPPH